MYPLINLTSHKLRPKGGTWLPFNNTPVASGACESFIALVTFNKLLEFVLKLLGNTIFSGIF